VLRQKLKSLSLAQATLALEASGDAFLLYQDAETHSVSVLSKTANGGLTLIETQV
jgi:hypothetical protein